MPISTAKPTPIATTRGGCGCCGHRPIISARTCASCIDKAETTAYYFIIPRALSPIRSATSARPANANDTTSQIQNNNLGTDKRDILDVALKLDYNLAYGTITSITDFNHTQEIDTGDAYDFRPVTASINYALLVCRPDTDPRSGGPFDESQSQFIDVRTTSQELRFTSPAVGGFSWIAGAYFVHTNRFISTGNLADRGDGVPAVFYTPIVDPTNPYATNTNQTFLADSQDNNAWAVFGDATYEFTKQWELDLALRYDQDNRENTTLTPDPVLADDYGLHGRGAQSDLQCDAAQRNPALQTQR